MRQKMAPIDGGKNDIRLIVSDEGWSEDSGIVNGEPIDPPDESGGWSLVDFWVEYDEEQITEERSVTPTEGAPATKKVKVVTTRKVKPQLHALWVKPKTEPKKAKKASSKAAPAKKPEGEKKPKPATRRGRPPKVKYAADVPVTYTSQVCPHVALMLRDTINVAEKRDVSLEDVAAYEPACKECKVELLPDGAASAEN